MPVVALPAQPPAGSVHLLDVPYLPQSEALCGGAAIAMIMRYWGTAGVYAETFANLVDPAAGGIRGSDLLAALRSRGWTADSFRGEAATVQARLAARQPVVALLEDRPGRFHYVVVVGWSSGRVIVHDPARAPFRILTERAFDEAWRASGYWTLIATPPAAAGAPGDSPRPPGGDAGLPGPADPGAAAASPCRGMVDEGVRLSGAGDPAAARRLFELAAESCPRAAAPWREMAGLYALAGDWPAAAADARRALDRDPADALAARILATSLYLDHDPDGALEAWNRTGEPVIDLVNITGLERIRYAVAARAMRLPPRTVLTREAISGARRRLADLPAVRAARVQFRPGENGLAQVDAAVLERPLLPDSRMALIATGLRAVTDREARLLVASPAGGGETWTTAWQWWARRPRVAFDFNAPAPFGGLWGVGIFAERQSYLLDGAADEQSRRRAEFRTSNWTNGGLRWEGSAALDRFRDPRHPSRRESLAVALSAEQRFAGDTTSVAARAGVWIGGVDTWTVALHGGWRSRARDEGTVWLVRGGGAVAASQAPLALWPGAGTGHGRDGLLRAHPLLERGIIQPGAFGRRLADGGLEWRRWMQPPRRPIRLAPAIFLDTARAWRGLARSSERWYADIGAGLRIAVPGSGTLRVDIAHGLRDGRHALSVGWSP